MKQSLLACFALAATVSAALAITEPAIIPLPGNLVFQEGTFSLTGGSGATAIRILADPNAMDTARYLAQQLRSRTGLDFPIHPVDHSPGSGTEIRLRTAQGKLTAESYALTIAARHIEIRGHDAAGVFYGVQTLLQLLSSGDLTHARSLYALQVPCLRVVDSPRFRWRGLMLDVSRHFFTKQEIERMLDAMALYKLNTFHWHLVDDQGWRIQINKYPRLTGVGAWRQSVGFGLDPKKATSFGPDRRYGGFYTANDVREVVAYAQARHITIVPEIEMPGHSCAALMAYPEFSCTGGPFTNDLPGGIFDGVFCAGNDESFRFMENVLSEVIDLFPGKYIHIGGDEVLTNNWKACVKCQVRMRQEGLHHEMELEGYFIRRMEKFINGHGRRLIGWSEVREGGLSAGATIMDWAGGAVEAASSGHDVVMSPLNDCYFDHYQSKDTNNEPHSIGGYLPIEQVYAFEPVPAGLVPQNRFHIIGAQANVWTEYMPSFNHVQYMVFPRLCALAEVLWSRREARDWNSFSHRLDSHYKLLAESGINYRHPTSATQQASSIK
jgi:hexosaminidase